GGVHPVVGQDVEDIPGHAAIRAGIEGEGDLAATGRPAVDHERASIAGLVGRFGSGCDRAIWRGNRTAHASKVLTRDPSSHTSELQLAPGVSVRGYRTTAH